MQQFAIGMFSIGLRIHSIGYGETANVDKHMAKMYCIEALHIEVYL